jgi:alkyl hydroperoxide reductase subunit F
MVYDVLIIGAGPAGITATIYAVRKGLKTMVISKDIGGQVTKTGIVDNYTGYQEISGPELSKKFEEHLKEFNFKFIKEKVEKLTKKDNKFVTYTKDNSFKSKIIIMATGARPRRVNVPGEKEFKNKGVTYCATCDAPLFKNKDVAIIGGGSTGLETALQLNKIANKIYLIEISKELSGDKILADKVKKLDKVKIFLNSKLKVIKGDDTVSSVVIEKNGKKKNIKIQGVFISIGYIPNTILVKDLVNLNKRKEIRIHERNQTGVKGLFAAGDCTNIDYKQIIIAAGEGAKAALSAFKHTTKF